MVDALEKSGYVKLVQDTDDRRKYRVISQNRFEELGQESSEIARKFMAQLYDGISKEELKSTLDVLVRMENNIGGFVKI